MYFTFRFPFWGWWSPAVTRIGWKQCRAIEVAENRCGFQKETGYRSGFPTRAHASTGPSSSAFLCTFNTWSWKTHYWHHVLGLIHLGLDSPKMLSTSNIWSYFSTCVKLTGIIHALKTKHVLCWKVPWMCCRGKASVHPEEYVRGLPVLRLLKLQKLMSLAAKAQSFRSCSVILQALSRGQYLLLFTAHPGESIAGSATCWCVK